MQWFAQMQYQILRSLLKKSWPLKPSQCFIPGVKWEGYLRCVFALVVRYVCWYVCATLRICNNQTEEFKGEQFSFLQDSDPENTAPVLRDALKEIGQLAIADSVFGPSSWWDCSSSSAVIMPTFRYHFFSTVKDWYSWNLFTWGKCWYLTLYVYQKVNVWDLR